MLKKTKNSKKMFTTKPKRAIKTASLLLTIPIFLSGCSTLSSGVDAVGNGVVTIAEKAQQITADVKVNKIDNENFELQTSFNEPVKSLDSWALRIEARELCPDGYVYDNRNIVKSSSLNHSDADCIASGSCAYTLQWRIKCQEVPDEPFSFFGKT